MVSCNPGDEVGEFVLEARLGAGAFGSVWKARQKLMPDRVVAIKLFPPETEGRRIVREAQALRSVQSPHVPKVLGGDPEAQTPFIVMEFIPGESLRETLARKGRLREKEALDLAAQVLRGLSAAHKEGVLHRDIKPENILGTGSLAARGSRVVLVDFGLARLVRTSSPDAVHLSGGLRSAEGIAGTPVYMAPEVLSGGQASAASDLFSLALVLHECVTGRKPTAVRTFTFPLEGVSAPFSEGLRNALAEDPSTRWTDAPAMAHAIVGGTADTRPAGPSEEMLKSGRMMVAGVFVGFFICILLWNAGHEKTGSHPSAQEPELPLVGKALPGRPGTGPPDPRPAEEQHKDAVDVNGTAELVYLPGPTAGGSQSTGLTAKDGRTIMGVYLSPGEGFGDTTWWVNAAIPGGGTAQVVGEFHLDRDGVGATRTTSRDVVYDASVPGPRTLRQTFTSEVTALDRDATGALKRISVRVTVRTAR